MLIPAFGCIIQKQQLQLLLTSPHSAQDLSCLFLDSFFLGSMMLFSIQRFPRLSSLAAPKIPPLFLPAAHPRLLNLKGLRLCSLGPFRLREVQPVGTALHCLVSPAGLGVMVSAHRLLIIWSSVSGGQLSTSHLTRGLWSLSGRQRSQHRMG